MYYHHKARHRRHTGYSTLLLTASLLVGGIVAYAAYRNLTLETGAALAAWLYASLVTCANVWDEYVRTIESKLETRRARQLIATAAQTVVVTPRHELSSR
jgi:hypothetical protein